MEKYLYTDLYNLETKHWWHISKRQTALMLLNKFLIVKKPKILDIGCGTGQNVKEFEKLGESWGIDNSKEAIKFCNIKGIKNVKLGNIYKTGFKKSEFDAVTLLDVLEHVEEGEALEEIKRILKKDGLILIHVPAFKFLWSKWDEVLHHKRRYTLDSLTKILEQNNFEVLESAYLYSFLVLPAFLVRKIKSRKTTGQYKSDFQLGNPVINQILLKLASFERSLILNFHIPFGTSLISIAKATDEKR